MTERRARPPDRPGLDGVPDRRSLPPAALRGAVVAALACGSLAVLGCAAPARPLTAGPVLARGALTYDVAVAGGGAGTAALTVELTTGFQLVARTLGGGEPGHAPAGTVRWRAPLGRAAWDVVDLALDPAGRLAATASLDGSVRLFDPRDGSERGAFRLEAAATAVAISPSAAWVATGSASGIVCLRRASDGALLQCVAAHASPVTALAFCQAPGGARLASTARDGRVTVWETPSLAVHTSLRPGAVANALAFAPGCGRLAVAVGSVPAARLPPPRDRHAAVVLLDLPPHPGRSAASPPVTMLRGHEAPIVALAFLQGGARLLTGSWDRTVRLWDSASGTELARVGGFANVVRGLAVSADGRRALVASWADRRLSGRSLTVLELRP